MRPRRGHLHVLAVPAVVGARAVGGEVEAAQRRREAAGPAAAEDVQVAALVVVVAGAHEAAPGFKVLHDDRAAGGVAEGEPDLGVGTALDHRSRPHVHGVDALAILLLLLPLIPTLVVFSAIFS